MTPSLLSFVLCSLILQSICVVAQTKSTIVIGDSFTAQTSTSPWLLSPSGDFAFGFLPLKDTNLFLLSIWYPKISEKTVVWYANGDSPAPKGSKAELTANDGLVLTSPNGVRLWNTEGLNVEVSRGVLNDTGNFVLQDGKFNSLWETFKFPSDTLLPSQVVDKGRKLSSRLKETDFSKGRFELILQSDGNLVMHSINLPSGYVNENYFESNTIKSSTSSAGAQLVFDKSGYLYVLGENNEKYNVFEEESNVSTTQFYLRATLNFDGVFTLYKHPKSSTKSEGWTTVWSKPFNICTYTVSAGSGVCGYNSFCTLGDDKRPKCQCPKQYSLIDPNDPYGSCKPDFVQGCGEDDPSKKRNDLYEFEILIDTDWPLSDYVLQRPFTEEQCRKSCMDDCLCSVAIFRLGDSCWKKKLPLSNGRVDATLNGAKAFLKVRKDNASHGSTVPVTN
uniref:Bulb-type lectin domain-containing protein n=1 Tax=Medicago truncatula TaxID=3880 RepID=I3T3Q4_MEDTR|nr:unknown [Medicago truncatula]